jgi:5'-deoxynucleotidase YfbR-like HD superfamily hydrolase
VNVDHLRDRLRAGGTQRYHTNAAEMLKTQDVAQHVYGVMWLVTSIMFNRPSAALLLAALAHDAGERWTGDVPSPAKRRIPGVKEAFDAAEIEEVAVHCDFLTPKLTETEAAVLDLADALDGAFLCAKEATMGNRLIRKTFANFINYADRAEEKVLALVTDDATVDTDLIVRAIKHLHYEYNHDFYSE